ncbi:MAG: hypothetical protein FWD71_11240 [Oscillospiraceae bacterium]|nr:hypothetical protein [Oscillospiraceae bacterium]
MGKSKIKDYIKKFLNTIFPVKCVCCKTISKDTNIVCDKCMSELVREAMRKCRFCGRPPYLCRCKTVENIEDVVTPFFYTGEKIKTAIYAVKKANLYYINEFFAKGMYNSVKSSDRIKIDEIDYITFIPRMKKSVRKYGYNQTKYLAKLISKYSGIPCLSVLNASRLYKREQKTLSKSERILNVKDKFSVAKNKRPVITTKTMLLIDDIVTTGSTLSECARVMKQAGAYKVYALCAASVFS